MKLDALEGESLVHSALRASSSAAAYFKAIAERALLVMSTGASAPKIPAVMFNYFGVRVEIPKRMTPEALATAIQAEHGRRFMDYRKHLKRDAKVRAIGSMAGTDVLEAAWTAVQQAQNETNVLLDKGLYEMLRRYRFEFNGQTVEFNPYTPGHELAEDAMNQLRAAALEQENTPEGQAAVAKLRASQEKAKVKLDSYIETLPAVLKKSLTDVLRWIEGYSKAYNVNQRMAKAGWVVDSFHLEDYHADVYVGEAAVPHILNDKQVLGSYIVGQFLATLRDGRPMPDALEVLLAQYRARP